MDQSGVVEVGMNDDVGDIELFVSQRLRGGAHVVLA